ncbi:MAG: UbiD family decarboxylase [Candidatus Tectomicrobia bacterium]|nr:UbiD family decarboxylase [Candidatus Tectomicrobia bacterium]
MGKDLRSFLAMLEQRNRGELLRITRQVDPVYEVSVIQQKLAAAGRYPVLYFEDVRGSSLPLVTNLFGTYDLLGLALDVVEPKSKADYLAEYLRRENDHKAVREVPIRTAPVKQIILTGDQVDLSTLPIAWHAEKDSGRYIVVGGMVMRDPETGVINVGMYRHEVRGNRAVLCMFIPAHHAAYIYRRYKELKRPMEAALFIGHHPAVCLGMCTREPIEVDEYEVMGGFLDEALEVVPAETVDLPVPARAEIVLEGTFDFAKETLDGPFAEYTGYYGHRALCAWFDVRCITMRRDAIYHDLDPAHREHNYAATLGNESAVYKAVKNVVPSVRAVHRPASGCCVYHVYVSISKRLQGEGKMAGLAALSAVHNIKHVFVVDEDVDIYNEEEVLWAVATRLEADQDISIISHCLGANLDPSAYGERRFEPGHMTTKVIFDATRPVTLPFSERITPPKEVWDRIKLEDYIDGWSARERATDRPSLAV